MKIRDDMVIREKAGYIFGYDSIVSILPEMKLGKLYNPHTVFDLRLQRHRVWLELHEP